MNDELIGRLVAVLPDIREWIDAYLRRHSSLARTVHSTGLKRLAAYYPAELLRDTWFVKVEQVEFPPLASFGLPEFAHLQPGDLNGITFKDTYFLRNDRMSASTHFHELVHVLQWGRLGVDKFLLAYGVGLIQFGYEASPLERMAFDLQRAYEEHVPHPQLVQHIESLTDTVWSEVAPLIPTEAAIQVG